MKTILFTVAALSLMGLAAAQPHRVHRHKRNVVTEVDISTVIAANVVIYVDEYSNPLTTSTVQGEATPAPAPADPALPVEVQNLQPPVEPSAPPAYTPPVYTPLASPTAPAPAPSGSGLPLGIAYSPYLVSSIKSQDQFNSDFAQMGSYSLVRLYGVDNNQVAMALKAAPSTTKFIVGLFDPTQVANDVPLLIKQVDGDWTRIVLITVGNEHVSAHGLTVGQVTQSLADAQALLTAAGYPGPVSIIDRFDTVTANPGLCASKYVTFNCHPFFNPSVSAPEAGGWVADRLKEVKAVCGNDKIYIVTETGWPNLGNTNGRAVPSLANQQAAIASLKEHFPENMVHFTAFNDPWKSDGADTFGAEKYWGILG